MPVSTNAFKTASAKLNREELSDVIDLTQRSDTPIYSMIGGGSCKTTFPEWGVEEFDAPGDNAATEGRDYDFDETDANERMGNHTQIMTKSGKVTNTQESVANAGKSEKLNRKKVLKGVALKGDVEFSLVAANASVGGDTRKSGSLASWAETNVNRGAGGANGGYTEATKVTTAPTDGAQRAFTKDLLDDLLQTSFSSGAKLKHLFVSPYNKRVFAGFMSDSNVAQFRYAAKNGKNTMVADAEVYLGPLGQVYVHPNHIMGAGPEVARNAFVLDTTKISWAWLRKIKEDKELAKTGDYKKFVLQGEGTLCPKNEKAVGVIADLFGMSDAA